MKLDTDDHPPIKQKPYRLPFSQRLILVNHLNDLMKADIIKNSTSPWASPIIMVSKKDFSLRLAVDYRHFNLILVKTLYALPDIADILASMSDMSVFLCLDLKSGYYQTAMKEEVKEKTVFVCNKGLFEFNVLPFGLASAPFQELMNRILDSSINHHAIAYLDDIIII